MLKQLFLTTLLFVFNAINAQNLVLDNVYAETYSGFNDGEIGECLQKGSRCDAFFTQIFPFQLPNKLAELKYKRIFKDSSRLQIAREYVRNDSFSYYFAEYGQQKQLLSYGQLYLSYDKIVTDTLFEYDSLYNEIPKSLLSVQPIRIFKTGLWQESQKQAVKAGFYSNDIPVGIWKIFALPVMAEFDMASFLFHYQSGQIAKRDTINILEKKNSDIDIKQLLSGKWINHYENKNYLMLSRKALDLPCEVWEFLPTGEVKIQAIYTYNSQKEFVGSWQMDKSLEISLNIPDFGNPKIQLRYLDKSRLLFFK